ncbi:MAG: SgcJ/EcaC family oxidoreductase [Parachlamydiaceae bacterium]|nr:SgcJ/EcaC family oxidoreductase [Parachlamydiaceae bacterium]
MQIFSKTILTLLTAGLLAGCDQTKQNDITDKKAIKSVVQSYQEAFNKKDTAKLTSQMTADATYRNPVTGESAKGREAIEKLFKEKFEKGQNRRLDVTIKSIEFPNADEAIENGVMKVIFDDKSSVEMAYQAEYVRESDKWLVKAINMIELSEPSSNFEKLKELSWLIGKWIDYDANVEIGFDNQWDKYKNFITQHFKMKIYGHDDIEGKQIIAWDPIKEVIRSWVFDSDGEFGEGTWKKVDNSWYATMRYTLSDGRIGTSKNVYTFVDDSNYTFASIEREVDGEILPDINPVTVEKIE